MSKCVYCEKQDDLNTSFSVKLEDGTKITVDICDDHADDATPKTAKEAYQANQVKIEEVLKLAKSLGLNITEAPSGLTVATAQSAMVEQPMAAAVEPVEQSAGQPAGQPTMTIQPTSKILTSEDAEKGWVDTGVVDGQKGMNSVGGSAGGYAVSAHASHVVGGQQDHLPQGTRRGKVKMELVEGRGGQPLAIPGKRVDGTGTTRLRVVQKEDDHKMQRRFKDMASTSRSSFDNASGPDFRSGYNDSTRSCPICRGDCVIDGQDCPKCDGMGIISVF